MVYFTVCSTDKVQKESPGKGRAFITQRAKNMKLCHLRDLNKLNVLNHPKYRNLIQIHVLYVDAILSLLPNFFSETAFWKPAHMF